MEFFPNSPYRLECLGPAHPLTIARIFQPLFPNRPSPSKKVLPRGLLRSPITTFIPGPSTTHTQCQQPESKLAAVEIEIPIPVPVAMYTAMHSGHFGSNARISPGVVHLTTVRPRPPQHFEAPSDNIPLLSIPLRHTHRDSSTTRRAGSAGSPRASPPTAPDARARSCRGSSTWSRSPRRRGS